MKRKIKHEQPSFDGYRYIPAALCLDQYNITIYVRYCRSKWPNDIYIKQRDSGMIWLVCPDREIVIVNHSFEVTCFHPNNFDVCMNLDMFNQETINNLGLNYVMNNFVHDCGNRSSANSRAKGNIHPDGHDRRVTVVGDSGGFQYVSGQSEYVNPVELGKWYSKNVDAGMQLDIPLSVQLPDKELLKFAQTQNRTTEVIKANMDPRVELFNVTHGKTIEQRSKYREIIETANPDTKRMAMGGMRSFGPLGIANTLQSVFSEGKRYSQYHLLGITSSNIFPVLICMSGIADHSPHITSDSASHKLAAKSKKMYFQSEYGKLRMIDIGNRAYEINGPGVQRRPKKEDRYYTSVTNNLLHCRCQICNLLKYQDILGILNGQFSLTLLSIHNMIETASYVRNVKEVFASESLEDFITFIKTTHATSSPRDNQDLNHALDFMLEVANSGYSKAKDKYKNNIKKSVNLYTDFPESGFNVSGATKGPADVAELADVDETPKPKARTATEETERLIKIRETSEKNLRLLEKGKTLKNSKTNKGTTKVKGW